jgi:hypothetical protein
MPATLAGHIGEQLEWEQLAAVVGEEGVHRPVGDQVATPGRRVQLGGISCVGLGAHAWKSASSQANGANHQIDTFNRTDRTTPLQQTPRAHYFAPHGRHLRKRRVAQR